MEKSKKGTFIKVKDKVLKIEDEQQDPLLSLGFKRTKTAPIQDQQGQVSVQHEETPSVTKREQSQWRIPSAVSNWKNTKGFMIDLDKRAPGNEGKEVINVNRGFADLSSALAKAESSAKDQLKEKAIAREEREKLLEAEKSERLNKMVSEITNSESTVESRQQKRLERRRKAAEELSKGRSTTSKLRELVKDQNREVSERVIIGASESLKQKDESTFDSTLFLNGAVSSGRASHKSGQLYDTPLFGAQDALNNIYRARSTIPKRKLTEEDDNDEGRGSGDAVVFVKDSETKRAKQ